MYMHLSALSDSEAHVSSCENRISWSFRERGKSLVSLVRLTLHGSVEE